MHTMSVGEMQKRLASLLDQATDLQEPVRIIGKRNNAILISEDDWRAINETLYLLNIPGLRESIREGLATPLEECDDKILW